jgi:di/tricarboxylate transporter
MSNTAVAAMLIPIGVAIAKQMNLDPLTIVLGILFGSNLSFATPIATPAVTLTLQGGYRFKDYLIVGGAINVLAYLVIIIVVPMLMPLR